MSSVWVALLVVATTLGGGAIGLTLQRRAPAKYTSERSRDHIISVVGLITLLLALVLGLLIWSSYAIYTTQRTGVQNFASQMMQLDLALEAYGPETKSVRDALKKQEQRALEEFWGDESGDFASRNFQSAVDNLRERTRLFEGLRPATEDQKQALAAARQLAATIGQTRLSMALQLDDPVAWPLIVVVASWAFIVFCGHGLLARTDRMVLGTMTLGAAAVASAIYLIVDLSQPYTGLVRVSSAPLERVLADVDK